MARCSCTTSVIWSPIRITGLSEVIGSWKIIEMRLPRILRISASLTPSRSVPSSVTEPPTIRPGGSGTSRMIDSALTLLPQPDSPTIASVSPRRTRERDVVDRPEQPRIGEEHRLQVLHLENRLFRPCLGHQPRCLGSRMSRSASPNRLVPNTARLIATPGKITSHGAVRTYSAANSDSMRPQDG